MEAENNNDPRDKVKLTKPENLYQIKDKNGQIINIEKANGRQLFNHYRHNMTNYDDVLDEIRQDQGYITGRQEKKAAIGAAEKVLEKYHEEHLKVIKDDQIKKVALKTIFNKAKVGTAIAVVNLLDSLSTQIDSLSEEVNKVANLERSQRSLQTWNDTYRVQRDLVKKLLKEENISPEVTKKVNLIYKARSVNKAIETGSELFHLEKSEILKIVKSAIRYSKLIKDS